MPRKGPCVDGLGHDAVEPAVDERRHAVARSPLPRAQDAVAGRDGGGVAADDDLVAGRDVFERLRHRAQVAHAVVDDGDALHARAPYNEPLVDGMASPARSSISHAMRSARPNAL